MIVDIFEEEQRIYDEAVARTEAGTDEYKELVRQYGKLLRQLRRSTRIADRTTINLHDSNVNLTDKVNYDALTGIYNRRFMEENIAALIKSLSRSGSLLSLLMLDIDFFKKYNDTYGHSEGDICLKSVAMAISECLKRNPDDFVARYGGEEFAVVLPNTDETGARHIAEKILSEIRAKNIPHKLNEAASCVTISIGGTTNIVEHTQKGEDYIRRADEALYVSKNNGRNQYSFKQFKEE